MDPLIQSFETQFIDSDGDLYDIQLRAHNRPRDTWVGRIVFIRRRDGQMFETAAETTQPSADAVMYWATGLTDAYFDGAFERARRQSGGGSSTGRQERAKPPR